MERDRQLPQPTSSDPPSPPPPSPQHPTCGPKPKITATDAAPHVPATRHHQSPPSSSKSNSGGFFFVVKEVSLLDQGSQGKQTIYQLQQEIALLSNFEHENIVQYYGTYRDEFCDPRNSAGNKNGYNDYLIEEEDEVGDQNVVDKCAEIQNGISEGQKRSFLRFKDMNSSEEMKPAPLRSS